MDQFNIPSLEQAPLFVQKCYRRVTQQLINCPVRVVSRSKLSGPTKSVESELKLPFNEYEREAFDYYQSSGFEVIRLEHFASTGVGRSEHLLKDSEKLGKLLRLHLPEADYQAYISRSKRGKAAVSLSSVYPENYPISCYPPDFLIIDKVSKRFKFVEVKGPNDKLHYRQANWYLNLIPSHWGYEIFASLNNAFEQLYLCNLSEPRIGPNFDTMHQAERLEVSNHIEALKIAVARRKERTC